MSGTPNRRVPTIRCGQIGRVLVTPHVAGLTDVTYREICVRPAEAVTAILTGIAPDPRWVYPADPVEP